MIEILEQHIVYENPKPQIRSRHGYFPALVKLPSGALLALFVMAEAFEAPGATTYVSRSQDLGRTWQLQGPVYDSSRFGFEVSDSLKPTVLSDGTLAALGYRFYRKDPEQPIAVEETGGFLPGDNIVAFSEDEGRHWTEPVAIEHRHPELIELSGPCIQTSSGDLLAVGAVFKSPDGSNPSGPVGVVLRSHDSGHSWSDDIHYCKWGTIAPYESRICEMQPGRLIVIFWAYDDAQQRHLPNHVTVSHDNGYTWSKPIDTGHMGQASNLLWLGDDLLLSIHAHRGDEPGIYVRRIDFKDDRWKPLEETVIWGSSTGQQTRPGQSMIQMFASLRFGQPSLLRLSDNEFLAGHWSIEEGQGKIRLHRLRITF